jgi:hypothetical protein
MRFYGVTSRASGDAVELFSTRQEAEAVVRAWNEDEPDQQGILRVEPIELISGESN